MSEQTCRQEKETTVQDSDSNNTRLRCLYGNFSSFRRGSFPSINKNEIQLLGIRTKCNFIKQLRVNEEFIRVNLGQLRVGRCN